MAILTFTAGEGVVEEIGEKGDFLAYANAFGRGKGCVLPTEADAKIQRIRAIEPHEAPHICAFLMNGGMLSEFRLRMAPEDWALLLDAIPEPEQASESAGV